MRTIFSVARRTLPALALVAAFVATPSAGGAGLPSFNSGGVMIPANAHAVLPTHNADTSSLNWSGYAAVAPAGSKITSVTQNWIVPSVSIAPAGFSSTWAGIGGYNTQDLIQAGTESDTAQTPYAWYEILPASETPITSGCSGDPACTVQAGDAMSVTITNTGGNGWHIAMTNPRWTWSIDLSYPSSESSAEWILEAPTVGAQTVLANVGTQKFTGTNSFVMNGTTQTIRTGNSVRILLSPGLVNEATPSALNSTGVRFNDCAYKQSCAAPA